MTRSVRPGLSGCEECVDPLRNPATGSGWRAQFRRPDLTNLPGYHLLDQSDAVQPMSNDRISCDPKVMMGKPAIVGTRITVESILERLAAGESEAQILKANPRLTTADIRAALQFAAEMLHGDRIYPHDVAA